MALVLGLRTVDKNRKSYHGTFQWPSSGKVVASDWEPTPCCGNGLHALPWGIGDGSLLNWHCDAIWQAVWVNKVKIVHLGDKVKFPECEIACEGIREKVIEFMITNGANVTKMVGGIVVDGVQAVANGYQGVAVTVSAFGHATANGYRGCAVSQGQFAYATANGDYGQAVTYENCGVAAANGYNGAAIAEGPAGQAFASGAYGHAEAKGTLGQATATGKEGVATANGWRGKAYAQYAASAGPEGIIILGCTTGHRLVVGNVGEDGIKPGVYYSLSAEGKFIPQNNAAPPELRNDFRKILAYDCTKAADR